MLPFYYRANDQSTYTHTNTKQNNISNILWKRCIYLITNFVSALGKKQVNITNIDHDAALCSIFKEFTAKHTEEIEEKCPNRQSVFHRKWNSIHRHRIFRSNLLKRNAHFKMQHFMKNAIHLDSDCLYPQHMQSNLCQSAVFYPRILLLLSTEQWVYLENERNILLVTNSMMLPIATRDAKLK